MQKSVKLLLFPLLILMLTLVINTHPVSAQAGSASDLINGVNSLRESLGLAPYTTDSFLMGFAQSHSDYMASIGTWTHTRADGTRAIDYGIKENVAMGTNMSIQYCIYTVWSDYIHWQTMTAHASGKVGAGVTTANGVVFYTLNVLPDGSVYNENPDSNDDSTTAISQVEQNTPVTIPPIATSTPDTDGVIVHIVAYGETLFMISDAYNVPMDIIMSNSGRNPSATEIFEGDRLIIQTAQDPTPTPINTETPIPPTYTPTMPRSTMTPFPTRTPAPTPTPTQPPSILYRTLGDGKTVGISLVLVSGLGLLLVIYMGFLKK